MALTTVLRTNVLHCDDYENHYQLKACKHAGNDKIANSDAELAAKASKLKWVSVGYPTLLYIKGEN